MWEKRKMGELIILLQKVSLQKKDLEKFFMESLEMNALVDKDLMKLKNPEKYYLNG